MYTNKNRRENRIEFAMVYGERNGDGNPVGRALYRWNETSSTAEKMEVMEGDGNGWRGRNPNAGTRPEERETRGEGPPGLMNLQ